jgi:hypothetical protein
MKNWLKRLFCAHIYKDVEEDHITSETIHGLLGTYHYKHFAIKMKCIKCGTEKYRVDKRMILQRPQI